jgi:type II secretory ATPase GspE/PulE/Tfp pilus assembly ATPase PilB-like protein
MAVTVKKSSKPKNNDNREVILEQELQFQKKLNNITNKIHSATDTDDILLNLREEILSLFDADRITIYVVDGIRKQIVSRFKTGTEISEIRVPISNASISGHCAASGEMLNISNAYDDSELKMRNRELTFDKSWDKKTGYRTRQLLVAPISHNKYLLGVIQLINKKNGPRFTVEDQRSAKEIASVLGLAFYKNQKTAQKKRTTKFDFLISSSIITEKDIEKVIGDSRKLRQSVETILMKDYNVSKEDIGKSLANHYKTRFLEYDDKMVIPGELLKGLKINFLKNNFFVPVSQSDDKVVIAMENPNYLPARDTINRLMPSKDFEYCVALKDDILSMIDLFFGIGQTEGYEMEDSGSIEDLLGQLGIEEEDDDEDMERVSEEDGAIVQLVNKMIIDAYNRNVSDIHIEPRPGKANSVIRFRIDGACQVYQTIPYTFKRAIVSRIKIMSDLDIAEKRLPQDGKIKFKKYARLDIELRVATIPTAGSNEDVVMRILAAGEPIPLDKMGMDERNYTIFTEMIAKPYGIALVVGPTGSGKTTTLHAALHHINKPETKIWTAEDPVEITQDGLRQVQVQAKIGFDFSTAMRAFLRADPDVIMVGEMRDHETVATGIEASLTGHLVFSTLHTNSAPETITRLLDMGMDPFNFADALLGVLAQRLVRTLCSDCKSEYNPDREEYDALVRNYDGDFDKLGYPFNKKLKLFKPEGCSKCGNTGYRGRTGLHEILAGTDDMKNMIQVRAKMEDLREQAIKDGMTTLMQDGIRKVLLGQTDLIQVRKVCIK